MPVYFIQAGAHGPVKIGYSSGRLEVRVRAIQHQHYEELRLIRAVSGWRQVEQWFHYRFAALRIRGEWFTFTPEMLTVQCPANPPRPPVGTMRKVLPRIRPWKVGPESEPGTEIVLRVAKATDGKVTANDFMEDAA